MKKQKKSSPVKAVLAALIVLVIAAVAFFAVRADREAERQAAMAENAGMTVSADLRPKTIRYLDEECRLRPRLRTLLVIGCDTLSGPQLEYETYYNLDCNDFVGLLVFDTDNKTVTPFHLNRDTMCDVPWIMANGKIGGWKEMQLALAHTYGSGGDDSCNNVRNAVSKLLFEIPIDHYLSFGMEAVPVMNDLVGGVEVTLDEDASFIDPSFNAGATVRLKGDQAMRFVRYRDDDLTGNLERMGRQRKYLYGFTESARGMYDSDSSLMKKLLDFAEDYLTTDMDGSTLIEIADMLDEYEILDIRSTNGTPVQGKYVEFYVDMPQLFETVKEIYC